MPSIIKIDKFYTYLEILYIIILECNISKKYTTHEK